MHVEDMMKIHKCAQNLQATLNVAVKRELKESMLICCDNLCKRTADQTKMQASPQL